MTQVRILAGLYAFSFYRPLAQPVPVAPPHLGLARGQRRPRGRDRDANPACRRQPVEPWLPGCPVPERHPCWPRKRPGFPTGHARVRVHARHRASHVGPIRRPRGPVHHHESPGGLLVDPDHDLPRPPPRPAVRGGGRFVHAWSNPGVQRHEHGERGSSLLALGLALVHLDDGRAGHECMDDAGIAAYQHDTFLFMAWSDVNGKIRGCRWHQRRW